MNFQSELEKRSQGICELCASDKGLVSVEVEPAPRNDSADYVYICEVCQGQISGATPLDSNHWRCLNDAMWSEIEAVKVVSWRMLNILKKEGWPNDLLEMMYMEEATLDWAKSEIKQENEEVLVHRDANGAVLKSGDNVVLVKDLEVKGGNFTAKRGVAVKGITLVDDNELQIEGRVNGQQIVLLTKFVKKSQ